MGDATGQWQVARTQGILVPDVLCERRGGWEGGGRLDTGTVQVVVEPRGACLHGTLSTALFDRGRGPEAQREQVACQGTWAAVAKLDGRLRALGGAPQPGCPAAAPSRAANSQGRRAGCN